MTDQHVPEAGASVAGATSDQIALWRAQIIADFRLRGAERCAAACPTPGFPQILDSILTATDPSHDGAWVDIVGGLGGAASWIERTHGRQVSVFDGALSNLSGVRSLFAEMPVACADVGRLPIRDRSVSLALVSCTESFSVDSSLLLAEASRILTIGGHLAISDLWSPHRTSTTIGSDTFRSLEDFTAEAAEHGLDLVHVAVADPSIGWWSSAALQVNEELAVRHGGRPCLEQWRHAQERLRYVLDNDLVLAAGIVLTTS